MNLNLDVEYTLEDMKELRRIIRVESAPARRKSMRRPAGFLLLIAVAMPLFLLLNRQLNGPPAPARSINEGSPHGTTNSLFFYVCGCFFIAFLVIVPRQLRIERIKRQSEFTRQRRSFQVIDAGISISDDTCESLWKWQAFNKCLESERQFSLRIASPRNYVIIPKRCVPASELDQLAVFIRSRVNTVSVA